MTPKDYWKLIYGHARQMIKTGDYVGSGTEKVYRVNGVMVAFCEYCGTVDIEHRHISEPSLRRLLGFAELRLFHELADIERHNPQMAGHFFKLSRDAGFKLP